MSLGCGVVVRRPKARRIEPIIHMCSRFNLARPFQGGVAKRATGEQLRLLAQVISLRPSRARFYFLSAES